MMLIIYLIQNLALYIRRSVVEIESIGAVLDNSSVDLTRAGLQQEDFLKVLLAQLSYQDPLEPMDNQDFIAQLAQFSEIEQSRQTSDRIESLLTLQIGNQALGLIGRTVEIQSASGPVVGDVTTVTFNQGNPLLTVQTTVGDFLTDVTLSQVTVVR